MSKSLIYRTRLLYLPNGERVEVNRLSYNLAYACNSYVQCSNTGWIKARRLKKRRPRNARS